MKYKIDYISEKNIIEIKISGRLNFKIAEQYSKEAVKLALLNDCSKFLFDHTETKIKPGTSNFHSTGDELQQFGFKETDKIAIVKVVTKQKLNLNDSENKNSSWSNFRNFHSNNIDEAYKWLLGI